MKTWLKKSSFFSHRYRFADLPAFALAGLLSAWAGSTHAELFGPSVAVTLAGGSGGPTTLSSATGPISASQSAEGQSAGAFADYGRNGAGVSLWATLPLPPDPPTGHYGYLQAESKWTDGLTVNVPAVAAGTPVDVVFSLGFHGHMEVTKTGSVSGGSSVDFGMSLNQYGTWLDRPSLDVDLGVPPGGGYQHAEYDVDEIRHGRFQVPNGATFNLISTLMTRVRGEFAGPFGSSFAVESAFDNTVEWLGASVWIGGTLAEGYSINSGSGFNYIASSVPEPSAALLLGIGFALLAALRGSPWRRTSAAHRPLVEPGCLTDFRTIPGS
ncbi:MAG: hypothetical protein JNL78_12985 [Rhodocyclaceae bacterium]|nr:hypothetical protein [Rhodocyclaceae bacterium]